ADMKQALPPLSARSLWANSRAAFPVHLTGAFRCGFHMDAIAVNRALAVLCGQFASELGELLFRIREILLIELQARFEQWNVRGRGCLSPADLVGIHLYGRWDDFGRIVPKTDR